MENIEWRDVVGYEGVYQVSNTGLVRTIVRKIWNGKGYYQSKAQFDGKQYSWNDPETAKLRSKTPVGVAKAMAEQWG